VEYIPASCGQIGYLPHRNRLSIAWSEPFQPIDRVDSIISIGFLINRFHSQTREPVFNSHVPPPTRFRFPQSQAGCHPTKSASSDHRGAKSPVMAQSISSCMILSPNALSLLRVATGVYSLKGTGFLEARIDCRAFWRLPAKGILQHHQKTLFFVSYANEPVRIFVESVNSPSQHINVFW
jgi:hypothetical protein